MLDVLEEVRMWGRLLRRCAGSFGMVGLFVRGWVWDVSRCGYQTSQWRACGEGVQAEGGTGEALLPEADVSKTCCP